MKSSIALLCFSIFCQVALSETDSVFDKIESFAHHLHRAKDAVLPKGPIECAKQVCDRIVNGAEYTQNYDSGYEVGDACSCINGASPSVLETYICKYEVDPISNLDNQGPNKKIVDSWACDIVKSTKNSLECSKELCDVVLKGKGKYSFKDDSQFGDRCSCTEEVESDSPSRSVTKCQKIRKVEDGKVSDSWICNRLYRTIPNLIEPRIVASI